MRSIFLIVMFLFTFSNRIYGNFDDIISENSKNIKIEDNQKIKDEQIKSLNPQQNTTNKIDAANVCDQKLRDCMTRVCDKNFNGCVLDGDTIFGDKLEKCRKETNCNSEEFTLFSEQIKQDRDFYSNINIFEKTVDCGNEFNNCIINKCGKNFINCLSRSDGEKAIEGCSKINEKCKEFDSSLNSKAYDSFSLLRQDEEKDIIEEEKKLKSLKDKMANICKDNGAMFDERTFDCVYTVSFFADGKTVPFASKKAYSGSMFSCTPDWFGIDITTFKENAFRETRAQKSASSAFMGAGLGTGTAIMTSMIKSGELDKKIAEFKQKKQEKKEKKAIEKEKNAEIDEAKEKEESDKSSSEEKATPDSGDKTSSSAPQTTSSDNNANKKENDAKVATEKFIEGIKTRSNDALDIIDKVMQEKDSFAVTEATTNKDINNKYNELYSRLKNIAEPCKICNETQTSFGNNSSLYSMLKDIKNSSDISKSEKENLIKEYITDFRKQTLNKKYKELDTWKNDKQKEVAKKQSNTSKTNGGG